MVISRILRFSLDEKRGSCPVFRMENPSIEWLDRLEVPLFGRTNKNHALPGVMAFQLVTRIRFELMNVALKGL